MQGHFRCFMPNKPDSMGEKMRWLLTIHRCINSSKIHACMHAQSLSHFWLFVTTWTIARLASLSMEVSRKEYWNGLVFPSPEDLPNPGIKPISPASPAWAVVFFTTEPPRKLHYLVYFYLFLLLICSNQDPNAQPFVMSFKSLLIETSLSPIPHFFLAIYLLRKLSHFSFGVFHSLDISNSIPIMIF